MSVFDPKQDAAALNSVVDHFFDRLNQFMDQQVDTLQVVVPGLAAPIVLSKRERA